MINKKGQGLSLNVIVVAAIVLIVMVVLIMIFTGRIGIFASESEGCGASGGDCVVKGECTGALSKTIRGVCKTEDGTAVDDKKECCLTVGA